jgi:hypothetical protein
LRCVGGFPFPRVCGSPAGNLFCARCNQNVR